MAQSHQNLSYWIDSFELPTFATLSTEIDVDVCVIGAGIVGTTVAALLARGGRSVALVEMGRVLNGTTGNTTAKVTSTQGTIYQTLASSHGKPTAAAYAKANELALDQIRSLVDEHRIDCDLESKVNYVYAESEQELVAVRREVEAAQAAGLKDVSLVESVAGLPFVIAGALRHEDQAQFHPLKYLGHFLGDFDTMGVQVFENARVVDVKEGDPCTVATEEGSVRCRDVVVATGYPILDRGLYFARVHPRRSYALCGVVPRDKFVEGMLISVDQPTRSLRTIDDGGRILLLVGGEGHAVGRETDTKGHYQRLEKWARKHFDMQEVTHRWSAQDGTTVDHIPFAGRLRRGSEHLYVAAGLAKWGMTNGTAAAMLITDLIAGNENPLTELYDPHRVDLRASMSKLFAENVSVARHFLGDRVVHPQSASPGELGLGEAGISGVGLGQVATYRDETGELHSVSAVCTHLGCIVNWNQAERTWDCPCHGSRFDYEGKVIQGPARRDLELKEI